MNLRDLTYLIALVEHRHFGKAAEACCVSQPALSVQIKKLEETLGVQLLERNNKSVLLTEVGARVAEHARVILCEVGEMRAMAKLAKDPFGGELQIGIIATLAPYLLPLIMPALAKNFPKLKIYLLESQTAHLLEKLKIGKLDAAFLALPLQEKELFTSPIFEEEFLVALPKKHALGKQKAIKVTDLPDNSLLLLEEGHCLREQALAVCHQGGAVETRSFRATSIETLRHMVAAGAAITLMPKLACKENDGITYLPFQSPQPTRTIGLSWRPSSAKKIVLQELVLSIKAILQAHKKVKIIP